MENFDKWLDYNLIDSYNAIINLILTTRGYGKSYGCKYKRVVERYLKYGLRGMYIVRRQQVIDDLIQVGTNLFGEEDKPNYEKPITTTKKGIFYGDDLMCYLIPLSKAKRFKLGTFSDVGTIMFDEFLIEEEQNDKYLKNEPDLLMNLVDTVIRNRSNVKIYLLGNATVFYNPYMIKWKLQKPFNRDGWLSKDKKYLVFVKAPKDFIEYRKTKLMGQLMNNTEYEEFALYNKFQNEKNDFIKKQSNGSRYWFTIVWNKEKLGVFIGGENEAFYISKSVDSSCKLIYAMDSTSHDVSTILVTSRSNRLIMNLVEGYKKGLLFFDSQRSKEIFNNVLDKLI